MERKNDFQIVLSCLIVLFGTFSLSAQRLAQYEYWFDNDINARSVRSLSNSNAEITLSDSVNTASLATGLHTFNLRLGTTTRWTSTSMHLFYQLPNNSSQPITALEYWFDDSLQNKVARTISSQNNIVMDSANTSSLSNGLHLFNIRFLNSRGWSAVTTHLFYKLPNNNQPVNGIEYWLGDNFANRQFKEIMANTEGVVLDSLNLTTLGDLCRGRYVVSARLRTQTQWSAVRRDTFDKKSYGTFESKAYFIHHLGSDNQTVFFTDSSRNVVSRRWSFGDGTFDTVMVNPTHRYTVPNNYSVKLVVKNSQSAACREDSITQLVAVRGINSIFPNRSANKNYCITTVKGLGFIPSGRVELFRPTDGRVLPTDTLAFVNSNEFRASFKFNDVPIGIWTLRVIQGRDTFNLNDAFTIETTVAFEPDIAIIAPSALIRGREYTIKILITNKTAVSAFAVPILITINGSKSVRLVNKAAYDTTVFSRALLNLAGDSTEFSLAKDNGATDSLKFLWLVIPYLSSYSSFSIDLKVKSFDQSPVNLSVLVGRRFLDSATLRINKLAPEVSCYGDDECVKSVGSAIASGLSTIPGWFGCGASLLGTACTIIDIPKNKDYVDYVVNIGKSLVSTAITCIPGISFIPPLRWTLIQAVNNAFFGVYAPGSMVAEKCKDRFAPKRATFSPPTRNSSDPNLKVGPQGVNALNCVTGDDLMPYTIYFENADTATAPASEVTVFDQLDTSKFDLSTLQFTGFGFGDSTFTLPPQYSKLKTFVREVDLRPRKNIILRVTGDVDSLGKVKWYFGSFDPRVMDVTQNIDDGFLPPNRRKPEGEGYVSFMIKPKPNLPHLTTFRNKADIVFDYNDAIATPVWTNTVDRVAPISRVNSIQRVQGDTVFLLRWSGTDNHAGVMDYSIYVSENGGVYEPFVQGNERDSAYFVGIKGNRYAFYSISRDYVGNIESKAPTAEVSTGRVAVQEAEQDGSWLGQNKPNPFSQTTEISYYLTQNTEGVNMSVFDLMGKMVHQVQQGKVNQGQHSVVLNLNHLASGVYIYQLKTQEGLTLIRRMVITK